MTSPSGRGGDHSELGAVDAEAFCQSHQLPLWDTQLVSWLVQNHLVMSTTAQRKDLSDPQVIFDFAQLVGDQTHLDYLYVLTVADINATNPTLWNSWRASLLRQLYTETKRALRRGLENPVDREEQIRQTQTAALDQLVRNGIDQDDAEQLWSQLGDDYFLRHTAGDVAWHTEAILQHPDDGTPLVLIKETTQREFESGSQIFIYAADQHDFFAVTVAAMDQLNLSIQDARIITSTSQFTLDTYIVLDADGDSIGNNPERIAEIREGLIDALKNPDDYPTIIQRRVPAPAQALRLRPAGDHLHRRAAPGLGARSHRPDRPGLLARIGGIFLDFDLSVQNAKIATLGERVEDVFYITDARNQPLADPDLCKRLQAALVEQLSQDNGRDTLPTRINFEKPCQRHEYRTRQPPTLPFEKLRALLGGARPPATLKPIALSIGEPKHRSPSFVAETLAENLDQLAVYPTTLGLPAPARSHRALVRAALLGAGRLAGCGAPRTAGERYPRGAVRLHPDRGPPQRARRGARPGGQPEPVLPDLRRRGAARRSRAALPALPRGKRLQPRLRRGRRGDLAALPDSLPLLARQPHRGPGTAGDPEEADRPGRPLRLRDRRRRVLQRTLLRRKRPAARPAPTLAPSWAARTSAAAWCSTACPSAPTCPACARASSPATRRS